jgi:hypothetical protein
LCGDRATRRSADGRRPVDNVNDQFDVAVHQVRATNAGSRSPNTQFGPLAPSVLGVEELTILTGWAQAVAEALAYAPECVETLLADAHAAAPWRSAFRIEEPCQRLSEAIRFVGRAVREVTPPGGEPTLDALLISCGEDWPGEQGLETLVRRVLRSTLEQVRTRSRS